MGEENGETQPLRWLYDLDGAMKSPGVDKVTFYCIGPDNAPQVHAAYHPRSLEKIELFEEDAGDMEARAFVITAMRSYAGYREKGETRKISVNSIVGVLTSDMSGRFIDCWVRVGDKLQHFPRC